MTELSEVAHEFSKLASKLGDGRLQAKGKLLENDGTKKKQAAAANAPTTRKAEMNSFGGNSSLRRAFRLM